LIKITTKGFAAAIKELKTSSAELIDEIDTAAQVYAVNVQESAKMAAPRDFGFLGDKIIIDNDKLGDYEIVVQQEYAPYIEFGTKRYVSVPEEAREIAQAAKGKKGRGSYEQMIDRLTGWVKRKGIAATEIKKVGSGKRKGQFQKAGFLKQAIMERQLAKFIAFIILTKGIKPQPFLFPSIRKHRPEFISSLRNIIRKQR
jgi:hypothetical protein